MAPCEGRGMRDWRAHFMGAVSWSLPNPFVMRLVEIDRAIAVHGRAEAGCPPLREEVFISPFPEESQIPQGSVPYSYRRVLGRRRVQSGECALSLRTHTQAIGVCTLYVLSDPSLSVRPVEVIDEIRTRCGIVTLCSVSVSHMCVVCETLSIISITLSGVSVGIWVVFAAHREPLGKAALKSPVICILRINRQSIVRIL